MRRLLLPLLFVLLVAPSTAQTTTQTVALPADFDAYVTRVMEAFDVPGMGVAVVKDGRVVLEKGYGVRDMHSNVPVDAHTLFGIASNTKAFTATSLGLLVEEGKIRWDEPVITYLPWFKTWDAYVTANITVRDLLVHRSGLDLGAGDLLWWPPTNLDRRTIAERLQFLEPVAGFRNAYAYDNVLYTVAGEVIEAVSGQSWEEFVQHRILDVVGMTDSNVLHSAAGDGGNAAQPHAKINGALQRVSAFKSDNTNPAGGINASVHDMAKWLITQLDSGRVSQDVRLYDPSTTRQLWSLVTPITQGPLPAALAPLKAPLNGYALGFGVGMYRGNFQVTHTGGLPGFVSRVAMLPEHKLGVVVLTNMESGYAFNAVAYRVLDHFLGAEHDWVGIYEGFAAQSEARMGGDPFAWPERPVDAAPPRAESVYAGTYRDAWYGDVYIEQADGLRVRFEHSPSLVGDLVPWTHDTFIARWDDRELRADVFVTFTFGPDGKARSAKMEWVSPATDFSYDFQHLDLRAVR